MSTKVRPSASALILRLAIAFHCALAAGGAAQASTLIDFERNPEPSVIFGDTVYVEGDYVVASPYDYAVIGYANADDPVAPVGNDGLYFNSLNGSGAMLSRSDGGSFDFLGLDVALLPSDPARCSAANSCSWARTSSSPPG